MAKTIISGFILFFLLIFSAAEPTSAAFWDTKGDNVIHDPSMIKEGNTWYTFGTGIGNGIRVIKSTDGKTWSPAPSIFTTPLSWWKKYVPNHEKTNGRLISAITMVAIGFIMRYPRSAPILRRSDWLQQTGSLPEIGATTGLSPGRRPRTIIMRSTLS